MPLYTMCKVGSWWFYIISRMKDLRNSLLAINVIWCPFEHHILIFCDPNTAGLIGIDIWQSCKTAEFTFWIDVMGWKCVIYSSIVLFFMFYLLTGKKMAACHLFLINRYAGNIKYSLNYPKGLTISIQF